MKQNIKILLVVLTIFFCSCSTIPKSINVQIPILTEPTYLKVVFEEREGGVFLDYENYRKLEDNIIEMRGYIKILQGQIDIFNGDKK